MSVRERSTSSYRARRSYRPGVVYPPTVPHVAGAVDIHCHAHEGQQDALSLAKLASESDMRAIVFKTIGPVSGEYRPGKVVRQLQQSLNDWAGTRGVQPIRCVAGYVTSMSREEPSLQKLRINLDDGVGAVWLPVFNHANSFHVVGAREVWIKPDADPMAHTDPLPWDEALLHGHYMLDQDRLKPLYRDIVTAVAERDIPLSFGHATKPELYALAELVNKLGFKKAFIDHPFSPFINLSLEQMKELASAGIHLNFTYDEISPLLGVDPRLVCEAIRSVGTEHVVLSSDAGEPLFPNSVECMRLIRAHMEAFGLTPEELNQICCANPSRLTGLN